MDSNWEFNCPQFVDFTSPAALVDNDADQFFDTQTNLEHIGTGKADTTADDVFQTPHATHSHMLHNTTLHQAENADKDTRKSRENHAETNSETVHDSHSKVLLKAEPVDKTSDEQAAYRVVKPKSEDTKEERVEAVAVKKEKLYRRSERINSAKSEEEAETKSVRSTQKTPEASKHHMRTRSTPCKQQPKPDSGAKPPKAPAPYKGRTRSASCGRQTTSTRERTTSQGSNQSEPTATTGSTPHAKPSLLSPSVLRKRLAASRLGNGPAAAKQAKTTEEMELDKIREMREELENRKKQFADSYQKAMTITAAPARAKAPTTRPKEFHFTSDQRIKGHQRTSSGTEPKEFSRSLRSSTSAASKTGRTVPQPFNLSANRKRKSEEVSSSFKSMAEQVNEFSKKTPVRFHSNRRSGPSPPKKSKPALTVPKTPYFETKNRLRPVTVVSQAELDEKELEEIRNYKFKAKPVNEKIFTETNLGVKAVPPKEPTVAIGFDLETERRNHKSTTESNVVEEEQYEFHARPVPKSVLNPTELKPDSKLPLTVPESPAFALKNRLRPRPPVSPEVKEKKPVSKPTLHTGIVFMPKLEHRTTELEPFSFEQRTEEMRRRREMRLQQQMEEEKIAREFHATPMPDLSEPDRLPNVNHKEPTIAEPFDLSSEVRGYKRAEEWAHKVEEEMKKQREMAAFKARPATVVKVKPFEPKKQNKPLIEINEFELNTQRRAEQRQDFERMKLEREQEEAERQEQRRREKEEEERQEVERLRQEATFSANPVRRYKTLKVHASDKPITVPESPRFSERLRKSIVRL